MQLKAIYSDIEFVDIMEAVCSDARNYVSDNPGASLEQFKEHIQINDVLCDWIENAPVVHVISKIDTKVVNKKNYHYCICDIIYTKSIAPAYVTETIVVLDETIYPDETDPTEFSSESSSESVE